MSFFLILGQSVTYLSHSTDKFCRCSFFVKQIPSTIIFACHISKPLDCPTLTIILQYFIYSLLCRVCIQSASNNNQVGLSDLKCSIIGCKDFSVPWRVCYHTFTSIVHQNLIHRISLLCIPSACGSISERHMQTPFVSRWSDQRTITSTRFCKTKSIF